MPISKSQRLLILEAIQTTLQGMTNGAIYNYPVLANEAVTCDPTVNMLTLNGVDLPAIKIEATPEGRKDYYPGEHLLEVFRVNLEARYDADPIVPNSRQTVWENLAADLERLFTTNLTLGGLVTDVRLLEPLPFVGVGSPIVILVQPLELRVHRQYGAP